MKILTRVIALPLICLLVFSYPCTALADVETVSDDARIEISISGQPVLTYHTETVSPPEDLDEVYARSGFIHPLYSPSGKVLTDDFPVGHSHQHALFSAWTRATFKHEVVDFWNQHRGTGTARHAATSRLGKSGFEADLLQVSNTQGPAINERWSVEVRDSVDPFIIDIEVEQACATSGEVYLHPYHYGGFGYRGSSHWNSEDKGNFEAAMKILTSDGISDIGESNHTRPRWVAVYGPVDGKEAGLLFMNHPDSFRFPQPIRVHPKMPYLVFSPVVEGSFILKPGMNYTAGYRIVTFDGFPGRERFEKWYEEYASNH